MPAPSKLRTKEGRVHATPADAALQRRQEGKNTDFQQRLRKAESTMEGNFMWKGSEIAAKGPGPNSRKATGTTTLSKPPGGKISLKKRKTTSSTPVKAAPKGQPTGRLKKRKKTGVPWKQGQGGKGQNKWGGGRLTKYKG